MTTKDEIIKSTAEYLIEHEGRISYTILSDLFNNKLDIPYTKKLYILYAMSVIAYKIPYYEDGKKFYRSTTEAFQDGYVCPG